MRLRPAADALDTQKVADDTTLDDAIGHYSGGSDEQAEEPRAFTCGYWVAAQLPHMRAERLPARRIPGRCGTRFLLFCGYWLARSKPRGARMHGAAGKRKCNAWRADSVLSWPMNQTTADLRDFIDGRPLGRFQLLVAFMCTALIFVDGFDAQVMGFVAPALIAHMHITRAVFGPVVSIGLVGMMIGGLVGGPLADRFGRKPVLVGCCFAFGSFSLLTATAHSVESLALFRLLTGLGLGGAMPNSIAITSEYMPKRLRATAITTMFIGMPLGAAVSGFAAAALVPQFG